MGLMQRAYETYCAMEEKYAGQYRAEQKEPLAPVSHLLTSAQLEITLDSDGTFVSASAVDKQEGKILIPVTEESAGRTSAPCAHPLCDQLSYLAPYNEKKHRLYVEQLEAWNDSPFSHPKLQPILTYVKGGTILSNLLRYDLIQVDSKGAPEKEKLLVRWKVLDGSNRSECWKDASLFQSFIQYYNSTRTSSAGVCMITGSVQPVAAQHPKGVVPFNGNAKLISANDSSGFTYRGRFTDDQQAASVSYEASQKAHSALRWVVANQGVILGGRTFLCWSPQGETIQQAVSPFLRGSGKIYSKMSDYKKALSDALWGWKERLPTDVFAVVAAFDAATTGRLALTYYSELPAGDFLQRLHDWDATCCWLNGMFGIQSPSLLQISNLSYGTPRTENGKTHFVADDRVLRQHVQRLLACRVDKAKLPVDFSQALFRKASNLQILEDTGARESLLFTACAVIRKYHIDRNGEEYEMALDPENQDISYQFGRLLAVLEKAERDAYNPEETREPNAMRLQSSFTQRPLHTFRILQDQIKKAYYPRLKPWKRSFYDQLIGEIVEKISQYSQTEQSQPLKDTYLLGYYLQKNALYQSKTEKNETEE